MLVKSNMLSMFYLDSDGFMLKHLNSELSNAATPLSFNNHILCLLFVLLKF